jgi:hypothetical protein
MSFLKNLISVNNIFLVNVDSAQNMALTTEKVYKHRMLTVAMYMV